MELDNLYGFDKVEDMIIELTKENSSIREAGSKAGFGGATYAEKKTKEDKLYGYENPA